MENESYITFGSQMGDVKAAEAVQQHLIELRKLLKKYCNKTYSLDLDELALIARVDGDIWNWGFEGCKHLRLYKKDRYITIDIGMPKNQWENVSSYDIRKYLFSYLEQALNKMVDKIKKEKIIIDDKSLFKDCSFLKREYLTKN